MKLLFLLKKNYSYNYPEHPGLKNSTGLFNSAKFVADVLDKYLSADVNIETCVDGNEIDKFVTIHKPDICFLEAIWVTPQKLYELTLLHSKVKFVIRVHSNIPFLAVEGIAIDWISKYKHIKNVTVAFNNKRTAHDFKLAGIKNIYLPNIYFDSELGDRFENRFRKALKHLSNKIHSFSIHNYPKTINIGCFGAIRPMKNQLLQAMAAIAFAKKHNLILHFHINATRVEHGDNVLKNIRALFDNCKKHVLIEHSWMNHKDFISLIQKMDVGMQLSLSESFNIVSADFVSQKVPIIVSPDITWMPSISKVGPFDIEDIVQKLEIALTYKKMFATLSLNKLRDYNLDALNEWEEYLNKTIKPNKNKCINIVQQ